MSAFDLMRATGIIGLFDLQRRS